MVSLRFGMMEPYTEEARFVPDHARMGEARKAAEESKRERVARH